MPAGPKGEKVMRIATAKALPQGARRASGRGAFQINLRMALDGIAISPSPQRQPHLAVDDPHVAIKPKLTASKKRPHLR
jgi:hypothetical protein